MLSSSLRMLVCTRYFRNIPTISGSTRKQRLLEVKPNFAKYLAGSFRCITDNIDSREEVIQLKAQNELLKRQLGKLEKELIGESMIKELLNERLEKWQEQAKVIGSLRAQMQMQSNALWFLRIRSSIKEFEDEFSRNADIEFPSYEKERDINIRRQKWNWIFKNKLDEDRVKTLVAKINASGEVTSTDNFSELIAWAFSELSRYIDQEILKPGSGDYDVKFATIYPHVNHAVRLFMDLFEVRDVIAVPKQNPIKG